MFPQNGGEIFRVMYPGIESGKTKNNHLQKQAAKVFGRGESPKIIWVLNQK